MTCRHAVQESASDQPVLEPCDQLYAFINKAAAATQVYCLVNIFAAMCGRLTCHVPHVTGPRVPGQWAGGPWSGGAPAAALQAQPQQRSFVLDWRHARQSPHEAAHPLRPCNEQAKLDQPDWTLPGYTQCTATSDVPVWDNYDNHGI